MWDHARKPGGRLGEQASHTRRTITCRLSDLSSELDEQLVTCWELGGALSERVAAAVDAAEGAFGCPICLTDTSIQVCAHDAGWLGGWVSC